MELVSVVVFVAEDSGSTLDYIRDEFGDNFHFKSEENGQINCKVVFFESVNEIKSKIAQRYADTLKDGKLYLSVGVLDLANLDYEPTGEFGITEIAEEVLNKELIPFYNNYRFRSVFVTNVFNYCTAKSEYHSEKRAVALAEEFGNLQKTLKDKIEKDTLSYYIDKTSNPDDVFGEGIVNKDVVKKVKEKLEELIKHEINYSQSNDSMYKQKKK